MISKGGVARAPAATLRFSPVSRTIADAVAACQLCISSLDPSLQAFCPLRIILLDGSVTL